ncbi:MAG TPA: hypothetical protein VF723_15580 [Pyrinomonadaceae bacterium]|jgi:arsenate reductase-like glutaredoxin family protein
MAEERNVALARASETTSEEEELSKEELQRRMEEARSSITQTVTEIKETVTNQYYSMKESVTEALDWRQQFRKRPIVFSVGALSVGFVVGYSIAGALHGDADESRSADSSLSPEQSDIFTRTGAKPVKYEGEGRSSKNAVVSGSSAYAAQGMGGGGDYGSSEQALYVADDSEQRAGSAAQSYSGGTAAEGQEESDKPGLIDRFKGTAAFDRLQDEVSKLGDRFIGELSNVGQNVVLPALFNKIRDMFGVDLSGNQGQQSQGSSSGSVGSAASSLADASRGAASSGAAAGAGGAGDRDQTLTGRGAASSSAGGSVTSYGTSENRGYGPQSDGPQ